MTKNIIQVSVIILLIIQDVCSKMSFQEAYHLGQYDNQMQSLQIDGIPLYNSSGQVNLKLKPNLYDQYFHHEIMDMTKEPKIIKLSIKQNQDITFLESMVKFSLVAEDSQSDSTFTDILLDVIPSTRVKPNTFKFSRFAYTGIWTQNNNLEDLQPITLESFAGYENVTIRILNGMSDYLQSTLNGNTITLIVVKPLLSETTIMKAFIIEATQDSKIARTQVILTVDRGSVSNPEKEYYFEEHPVVYPININNLPKNLTFTVKKRDEPNSTNLFLSFYVEPKFDTIKMDRNSGELSIAGGTNPGVYSLEIKAYITTNEILDNIKTTMALVVETFQEDQKSHRVKAPYSHLVKHLKEELTQEVLLLAKPDIPVINIKYGYCIDAVYPDKPELFKVRDGAIYANTLLRETEYFEEFKIPQFTLNLQMVELQEISKSGFCSSNKKIANGEEVFDDGRKVVIGKADRTTILTVIVDDVNNHFPRFDEHYEYFCYPTKDLISYIRPPYLLKVHATDVDSVRSGFGNVTYRGGYLEIHPIKGTVHPLEDIFDDDGTRYEIRASDGGGYRGAMFFEPRIVNESQIAVLEVKSQVQNVETFLKELSTKEVSLHALQINTLYTIRDSPDNQDELWLNVTVCALKGKQPLTVKEMIEIFGDKTLEIRPFEKK